MPHHNECTDLERYTTYTELEQYTPRPIQRAELVEQFPAPPVRRVEGNHPPMAQAQYVYRETRSHHTFRLELDDKFSDFLCVLFLPGIIFLMVLVTFAAAGTHSRPYTPNNAGQNNGY